MVPPVDRQQECVGCGHCVSKGTERELHAGVVFVTHFEKTACNVHHAPGQQGSDKTGWTLLYNVNAGTEVSTVS